MTNKHFEKHFKRICGHIKWLGLQICVLERLKKTSDHGVEKELKLMNYKRQQLLYIHQLRLLNDLKNKVKQ